MNHIASVEYRSAKCTIERDSFRRISQANSRDARKGGNGRYIRKFENGLWEYNGESSYLQRKRNRSNERMSHRGKRRSKMATGLGVNLAGVTNNGGPGG